MPFSRQHSIQLNLSLMKQAIQILKGGTFSLFNPNGSGEIYYTLNDTDPRASGGSISGDAILYGGEITAMQSIFIKARIKQGDEWSPLAETSDYAVRYR